MQAVRTGDGGRPSPPPVVQCPRQPEGFRPVGGVDRGLEMADIAPLSEQSEQLDLLLGKTTGLLEADDRISRCVARFLKKAWRSRKWRGRRPRTMPCFCAS